MIYIKEGVKLGGIRPEMVLACHVVDSCMAWSGVNTYITAGRDGKHKTDSKHYVGAALDFRSHDLGKEAKANVLKGMKEALGPEYDVLLEDEGTPNEHLHVEYDPKS